MIEGLAAGAMLTMIAQTMLPDAYFNGGSVIGLATLMDFPEALFFKSIQRVFRTGDNPRQVTFKPDPQAAGTSRQ